MPVSPFSRLALVVRMEILAQALERVSLVMTEAMEMEFVYKCIAVRLRYEYVPVSARTVLASKCACVCACARGHAQQMCMCMRVCMLARASVLGCAHMRPGDMCPAFTLK